MTEASHNHFYLLKGYLLACDAPPAIMAALEQLAVPVSRERVHNEDVRVPKIDEKNLAQLIIAASATAPSHDESRFAAPETAQPEAKDLPAAIEVAEEAEDAQVSTGGGRPEGPRRQRALKAGGIHAPKD